MATGTIKVTRLSDDALIYNKGIPQQNQIEHCDGDPRIQSVDSQVEGLTRQIAGIFAREITPSGRTDKIRIRESRTDMSKEDSAMMKTLIAATKKNEPAACAGWLDMETAGSAHPSVKFNLGLCAEARGALDIALGYYRPLAAAKNSPDAREAIQRVERRMAGEADYAIRSGE